VSIEVSVVEVSLVDGDGVKALVAAVLAGDGVPKMVARSAFRECGLVAPLPLGDGPNAILSTAETSALLGALFKAVREKSQG
jgi:hypothetical protein